MSLFALSKTVMTAVKSDPKFQTWFDQSNRGRFYRSLNLLNYNNPFESGLLYVFGPYETFGPDRLIQKCNDMTTLRFTQKTERFEGNIQEISFQKKHLIFGVYYFMSWVNQFQYTDG